jgi:dTDP-L-rhamnose 4-epimerase
VDVILPCLDEAPALPWVLERIPAGFRAIVVDNGSADGSGSLARSLGATVVHEPRRGFGAAAHAGLLAATADLVCFCDCDGSLDPRQLPRLAGPLLAGEADLVLGRRSPARRDAWPLPARLANRELARRVRRRTAVRLGDLGPMRAAGREALLGLNLTDRRFGYPLEMVLRAAAADGPALLIGMDTPQLTPGLLTVDWEAADAWFGPAADGGFWALGLRVPDPALVRGVPMSAASTGACQRARLQAAGLRVADLPRLRDVDTAEDAVAVAREVPRSLFAARVRELAPVLGPVAAARLVVGDVREQA